MELAGGDTLPRGKLGCQGPSTLLPRFLDYSLAELLSLVVVPVQLDQWHGL